MSRAAETTRMRPSPSAVWCVLAFGLLANTVGAQESTTTTTPDSLARLQGEAAEKGASEAAYWGWRPDEYITWSNHTNRLIPIYVFGAELDAFRGQKSPYRSEQALQRLYGRVPPGTLNPAADYLDQTNVFDLQKSAIAAGKKHVFLVVFDGLDWQITRAAAIAKTGAVRYAAGRGAGLLFQDYRNATPADFAWFVSSPFSEGLPVDVDEQTVGEDADVLRGGYDPQRGGAFPWSPAPDPLYPVGRSEPPESRHAFTDSASSATSMTTGLKTYNNAINVAPDGKRLEPITHRLQREGWSVGVVSSVPISHATPAAAYAHNVSRNDYQDISRDLLGLPSVTHPEPLPGMDVVLGGGFGTRVEQDDRQGANFQPGNKYLADADLQAANVRNDGKYVVAVRTADVAGRARLLEAAAQAADGGHRLLAFYGVGAASGHLPYATEDGDYRPVRGLRPAENYQESNDVAENPSLADLTQAALLVLTARSEKTWLMVEPGDVDWAAHDNNVDNAIGAVYSGEASLKVIFDWVEANSSWDESLVIVTADHGHYLNIVDPEAFAR